MCFVFTYHTSSRTERETYSKAELILTPLATLKPVLSYEGMIRNVLNEYKSHFSTDRSEGRDPDINI